MSRNIDCHDTHNETPISCKFPSAALSMIRVA
jgi:hypothetical protein